MNYGQAQRAVESIVDIANGELKDDTPVRIFVDGVYKEVIAIYPEDINDEMIVIIEAGR